MVSIYKAITYSLEIELQDLFMIIRNSFWGDTAEVSGCHWEGIPTVSESYSETFTLLIFNFGC